jgi:GT2 family glycosyltransferase
VPLTRSGKKVQRDEVKTAEQTDSLLAPKQASEESEPTGPIVSAIFVVYNQRPALRRAIEALERSRNREKVEILIVDCASTDGTSSLDQDFPSVNILRMPHHFGAIKALNIATRTAKAELLLFLSPNVEVEANTVEALAARLEDDSEASAACPLLITASGQPVSHIHRIPTKDELAAALKGASLPEVAIDASLEMINVDYPELDALMVRKAFVRGMNFFDERRFGHYWADADLAAQIRRAGKKIRLYTGIKAVYHPAEDPLAGDKTAQIDKINGAVALLAKYGGGGMGLRLGAAFGALARFDVGTFSKVLSGQKLDGSQAG